MGSDLPCYQCIVAVVVPQVADDFLPHRLEKPILVLLDYRAVDVVHRRSPRISEPQRAPKIWLFVDDPHDRLTAVVHMHVLADGLKAAVPEPQGFDLSYTSTQESTRR
jgi:hypothetical protein